MSLKGSARAGAGRPGRGENDIKSLESLMGMNYAKSLVGLIYVLCK